MQLDLDDDQANELRRLLTSALSELTSEIADTDNPQYSRDLQARRGLLRAVEQKLGPEGS